MNDEYLKVSIIIPVCNSQNTLNRCIESILSQSYKNVECILVENGSTDKSKIMCMEYAEKYKNFFAVSNQEIGVSSARNKGLALATGDIIGFCDADDFLEADAIKRVVSEFLRNSNVVAVFGGFNIGIESQEKKLKKICKGLKQQQISALKALRLTIMNDSVMGSMWNKYYKAEVLKNVDFDSSLSFCEDMHFNAKALSALQSNEEISIISSPIYCYIQNPDSVTHNDNILFDNNNQLKYIVALKKIDEDCELDRKTKDLLRAKIAWFCIDYSLNLKLDEAKQKKLIIELRENYIYLLKYISVNNWKRNIKRAYLGLKIILSNFKD